MQGVAFLAPLVGVVAACIALGVSRSRFYRARKPTPEPTPRPRPARALSDEERARVLATLDSDAFMDKAPAQAYAKLLEDGEYLCSTRTMYRVLAAHNQVRERRAQRSHPEYKKPQLVATAPNQVWSWDTTKLPGATTGSYFALYIILDIFSRFIVGWQKSHSRPHTSNDNPYSEANFRTMKYRPEMPERLGSPEHARQVVRSLVDWYNEEHYHVGLGLLHPVDVHYGRAAQIVAARQRVLDEAHRRHPERFVRGRPTQKSPPSAAWINPPPMDAIAVTGQRQEVAAH